MVIFLRPNFILFFLKSISYALAPVVKTSNQAVFNLSGDMGHRKQSIKVLVPVFESCFSSSPNAIFWSIEVSLNTSTF